MLTTPRAARALVAGWRLITRSAWGAAGTLVTVLLGWSLWFAVAWASYGHVSPNGAPDALLDRFMPVYEVAERHEIGVAASPHVTDQAARAFDLERAPVVHAILEGRRTLFAEPASATTHLSLAELQRIGWGLLAEEPGREVVFGTVTQPWRGQVTFQPLAPTAFAAFRDPGYAKIVWTLAVDSLGPRQSRFRTETRVMTTDAVSRAHFRRYWSLFSPGILLIRWQMIRLVRADAERQGS